MKKRLTLVSFAFFMGVFGLIRCSGPEQTSKIAPLELRVMTVTSRDVELARDFVGRTIGSVDAEVVARVQGVLTQILFREGGEVTEGQVLYEIDPAPFLAELGGAKGRLSEAQTKLVRAVADYARIKPLADIDAVSKRDLDQAIAAKGVAQGGVDAARAQVEAAEIQLSYTKVLAPTSGTIGISKFRVGELVGGMATGRVLNTVSKLDPIHVQFSLSEQDYLYFARLSRAQGEKNLRHPLELVLADGSIHPDKGELVKLDRQIDAQSGGIMVEAAFPNHDRMLRPGLFAKIRTVAETRRAVVTVPKRAVREIQGKSFVYTVTAEGVVSQRPVEVGPPFEDSRIVESGLVSGEEVVLDGIQRLRSGVVIAPVRAEASQG
jgi:membrane fusion protein (multidrug efflux system)